MAGALSALADPNMTDNMPVYGGQQPDTSGPQPTPMGGMYDPLLQMLAMRGGTAQPTPETPEVRNLYQGSQAMLGSPQDMTGTLSKLGQARDEAAQAKLQSIDRAMGILQAAGAGGPNLVSLMSGAAMMGPTRTGTFGESASNAGLATAQALAAQREIERQQALQQANLTMAKGDIPSQLAQQQAADFYKRIGLGQTLGEWAARSQAYNAMANARAQAPVVNAMARIDAANIAAGARTGRYKYVGPAPDGSGGVYLDTVTGSQVVGQGVQPKQSAFAEKYSMAQALYPNDPQKAYQVAIGKIPMGDQQLQMAADKLAAEQLDTMIRQGQTPDDPQAFVAQASKGYMDRWRSLGGQQAPPAQQGAPHAAPAPAQAHQAPATGGAIPPPPPGTPAGAQWSPSQQKYWWKNADGTWAHS
jgi:hypothetical protein